MAVKTPIRTVFNASNVATGLAEYQSGEFIALSHGGIGASLSIGTAGQILKVNSGASALEFGSIEAVLNIDGLTDGSGITLAASDKFAVSDGGTEKFLLASQIDTYISGTTKTLTNKTLTAPTINGVIGGTTTSQTVTNLTAVTIAAVGSITVDAVSDIFLDAGGADIVLKDDGTEFGRLTNSSGQLAIKSSSSATTALTMDGANVTIAGNLTVSGSTTTVSSTTIEIQNSFKFEGATADGFETNLTTIDPTADRTISLPNVSGTLPVLAAASATQISATPEELNLLDGVSGLVQADFTKLAALTASATELNLLDGVSGLVQADLTKLAAIDATAAELNLLDGVSGLVQADFTKLAALTASATELNFVDGVTSAIQTQLDTKGNATKAFAIAQAVALG
jgi:hypothetical protein